VARATRAVITGENRSASEWRDAGLVEFVVPAASLEAEVERWFTLHLAPRSAVALRHAAAAARYDLSARVRQVLPELERLYLDDLMRTHDAAEGIAAFIARRPPDWKNR
jgi:cyclohexa-1,5-dienecarbonyl-CoA hydratase